MKDYHVSFNLKAESTIENVKKILERGGKLGFIYEGETDKALSIDEALEEIVRNRYLNFIIDDVAFDFYFLVMSFDVFGHSFRWKRQFRNMYIPDNIKALNLLLDLTMEFIVKNLWISSYLQLLDFPERTNTIVVNSLMHTSETNEEFSDGVELFVRVIEYNYNFIFDPHKKQDTFGRSLPILEAFKTLSALQAKETYEFYLMVENYVVSLEIAPDTISLVAQEPIKLKTVDGQQDYDRAFYVRILLNLLKNIGIDELICTL